MMCMERIGELEMRAHEADEKHRATLVKTIMCLSGYTEIFVDVMAWMLGVTPDARRTCDVTPKQFVLFNGELVVTDRIRELHAIARKGRNDGSYIWSDREYKVTSFKGVCVADDDHDVAAMLYAMTTDELEGYWEWRTTWIGWGAGGLQQAQLRMGQGSVDHPSC